MADISQAINPANFNINTALLPKFQLPILERDFMVSPLQVSEKEWEDVKVKANLLHFTTHNYAMRHAAELDAKGIHYTEVLNDKGEFQRGFVVMQNPQHKEKYRLFEITYQYFDADKDAKGNPVYDSTGFKMCSAFEHNLQTHTKQEADQVAHLLTVAPTINRNLVKDENGNVKRIDALGGWDFEVGGGYNAWEIEHGRNPLQLKCLYGIDGKPKALEESDAKASEIGVDRQNTTVEIVANSMGTPNAQHEKYMQEKFYGQQDVKCMLITPMAQGQTLKQLTELELNLQNSGAKHLSDLKSADEINKAESIAYAIHDPKNLTTVYSSNNYFPHFKVNGNATINSAPGLPGDRMLLIQPDHVQPVYNLWENGLIDQGLRIRSDHLLPALNAKLANGPETLKTAIYNPHHSLHDAVFTAPIESKNPTENVMIETLHTFNRGMDRIVYSKEVGVINKLHYGKETGREPLTDAKLYEAAENYRPAEAKHDIITGLNPTDLIKLQTLQSRDAEKPQHIR